MTDDAWRRRDLPRKRSLLMVGTVHKDPLGEARLSALLKREKPDILTIEVSEYGISFRNSLSDGLTLRIRDFVERLVKRGELSGSTEREAAREAGSLCCDGIRSIVTVLELPFEYRAVRDYATQHHIPFRCIDLSWASRERLSRFVAEAFSEENLVNVLRFKPMDLSEEVEKEYRTAKRFLRQQGDRAGATAMLDRGELNGMRDRHMNRFIRSLLRADSEGTLLHVGGWEHLVEDDEGRSLYSLLKDLEPTRILLSDTSP